MSSENTSEYTPYKRLQRGVAKASSTTESTLPSSQPTTPRSRNHGHAVQSPPQERSSLFSLVKYIARSLHTLKSEYGFQDEPSLAISATDMRTVQYIGKGKTFYVSRITLPSNVQIDRSWPSKLVLKEPDHSPEASQRHEREEIAICKLPLLELDSNGRPRDGASEERIIAVILEIKALTHPPLYFHKNIVDFFGISWQFDISDFEAGQEIRGQPGRVPAILLERAENGSLSEFRVRKTYTCMSFSERASLCRDVAEGLAAMHRCGLVHGDIKMDNILIFDVRDERGTKTGFRAKLGDFGFSVGGGASRGYMEEGGVSWRDEHMLDGVARWKLTGRTWPWNDPEWNRTRTWGQLQKTDVYSYGLLCWSMLTGKDIWSLFGLDGNTDKSDPILREVVEGLKDRTLAPNAANSFREFEGDCLVGPVTERLFGRSLDLDAENRGTMDDILEVWNTLYFDINRDTPYMPVPNHTNLDMRMGLEDIDRVPLSFIIRHLSNIPSSVNHQFNNAYRDRSLSAFERFQSTIFRAFAHIIGWGGVDQNLPEAKRLIDEAAEMPGDFSTNAALFQLMFFERKVGSPGENGQITEYALKVLDKLSSLAFHAGSHEAISQMQKYFPAPRRDYYPWLRRWSYRQSKYGIETMDPLFELPDDVRSQIAALEWADIEKNHGNEHVLKMRHSRLHFAVFSGFTKAAARMLASEDFDPLSLEERCSAGDTPLIAACRQGEFLIAKLLVEAGASPTAKNYFGETALHFLVEFENPEELAIITDMIMAFGGKEVIHVVCMTRSFGRETVIANPIASGDPLRVAVTRGNIDLVKLLLIWGSNPMMALGEAAALHHTELLQLFWEVCPDAIEWSNCELLSMAIFDYPGHERMYVHGKRAKAMMESTFDLLLDKVLSRGLPLQVHGTPLIHLLARAPADIFEYLLPRIGLADIDRHHDGKTPLHCAIQGGSNKNFEILLRHGADHALSTKPNTYLPYTITTFRLCCILGTVQMLQRLIKKGIDPREDEKALNLVIKCNDFEKATALLDAGVHIDSGPDDGTTTLGSVVRVCSYSTVAQLKFLLDHQIAVGNNPASFLVSPSSGRTALHYVASISYTPLYDPNKLSDILDYLLHKFSTAEQLNAQDNKGYTALHIAAHAGNVIAVRRLLKLDGIDPSIQSKQGQTAYIYALERFSQEIPLTLRQVGIEAVERYNSDMVEVINLLKPESENAIDLASVLEYEFDWRDAARDVVYMTVEDYLSQLSKSDVTDICNYF
ncbi:hypothetical protein DFP73DRAFT_519948 [Morchella snyderi]|nr:hypothetical protein DFP73DRAFT_519948 [Morchella snyderi]